MRFVAAFMILALTHVVAGQAPTHTPSVNKSAGASVDAPSIRSAASPKLAAAASIPSAELEAFVDGVVHQSMAADHIAGVSVSIVQDGKIVVSKGYGFADLAAKRRVDPDRTLFRIGSITKTFTWIAVMKAVDAGKLGLDDPINDHLPPELRIPDQGFAQPIRLRHLMTHSPGFEDLSLGHLFEKNPAEVRPLARYLREERPIRVREPGVISSYSNYGVGLAAAVLQTVEGRQWQDAIDGEIIGPLGLTHTSVREPYPSRADLPAPMSEALAADLSKGYRWTGVEHKARDYEYITQIGPAGVMSSTAGDMTRYMRMLLNDGSLDGVQVFGPQTARAFRSAMTSLPSEVGNWDAGFMESMLPGGFRRFGHGGATLTFFANMSIVPDLRLGIFVATNSEGGNRLTGVLPARIVENFYAPPADAPPRGSSELLKSAETYRGYYLPTRRAYRGLQRFLFQLAATPVGITPDGYLMLTLFGQNYRLLPANQPDLFTSVEAQSGPFGGLQLRRDGNRVVRIEALEIALERVGLLFRPPVLFFVAGLSLFSSLAVIMTALVRRGRGLAATRAQRLAGSLQTITALVWLASAGALGLFLRAVTGDQSDLFYSWPTPSLLLFSSLALCATVCALGTLLLLPAVWRSGPMVAGWSSWRKLRFTLATLVFVTLGSVLGMWGALQPWNP